MARRRRDESVDEVDMEAYEDWYELLLTRPLAIDVPSGMKLADAPPEYRDRLELNLLVSMSKWTAPDHWCHAILDARKKGPSQ